MNVSNVYIRYDHSISSLSARNTDENYYSMCTWRTVRFICLKRSKEWFHPFLLTLVKIQRVKLEMFQFCDTCKSFFFRNSQNGIKSSSLYMFTHSLIYWFLIFLSSKFFWADLQRDLLKIGIIIAAYEFKMLTKLIRFNTDAKSVFYLAFEKTFRE